MPAIYDIQGAQSRAHRERGIARYLVESAAALDRHHPQVLDRLLLNRDLSVPSSVEALRETGRLRADRESVGDADIYHVGSPIELEVPVRRLWPTTAHRAGLRLVTTLYDLIPLLFADVYLGDPVLRRRYETRLELVRRSDRILAISPTTAADAQRVLGIHPDRITVVGTGVSERFRPAADRNDALAAVRSAIPAVEPGFLLYTGGIEHRKNIDRLLAAYAALPSAVQADHQLVVVCRVRAAERRRLARRLEKLQIGERVVFPGFVTDEILVALYQSTELFVFPSIYEGFGIPVAEAIASGAPVAVSRIPAVKELVSEPDAMFDPLDTASMTETLERCLTDVELYQRLLAAKLPASASWEAVADKTAAAYEDVAASRRRSIRRRGARIAFVTPLPPQRSGVAADSYRLIEALSAFATVEAVVDGPEQVGVAPPGVSVVSARNFLTAEALWGPYDQVFYALGNSEFHAGALEALRDRRGVVIAHDVRLSGLYGWIHKHRRYLLLRGFQGTLHEMYADLPPRVGARGSIDFWEATERGIYMAKEAIANSQAFLVHSEHAAALARAEAKPGDEGKIAVIPFRFPEPPASPPTKDERELIVGTFGLVSPAKQTDTLLDAWALVAAEVPGAKLAIVGSDAGTGENERLAERIVELGLAGRVVQTDHVDDDDFQSWIERAAVAVQLRAGSNGESSAVVAQTLAAGTPTIVTAIGSAEELPDEVVNKVARDVTPRALADAVIGLLHAPDRRASMAQAGMDLARQSSVEHVAKLLFERYVEPARVVAA